MQLAERLGAGAGTEIVCCDSLQVYRGMDVGTGKPSASERARVPHHMLDLVSPDQPFDAARWAALARQAAADIAARGRTPLVVGGTGLYFRALTRGLFQAPPPDPVIRGRHRQEVTEQGPAALHARLAAVDAESAARLPAADVVRVSRALEVFEQTGVTVGELRRRAAAPSPGPPPFVVVLDPPLSELRARIDARVDAMMAAGFLDEVRALRAAGYGPPHKPLRSLGYRELGLHIDGALSLVEAVSATKAATASYARRQRTWFRKEDPALRIVDRPDAAAVAAACARSG